MKYFQTFALLIAFAAYLSGPSIGQTAGTRYWDPVFTPVQYADIQYGSAPSLTGPGNEDLYLDVHAPLNDPLPTGRPVLIWTHGGGFTSGDKADHAVFGDYFAARGYVCLVINYRLNNSVSGPAERAEAGKNAASDQLAAVRWARLNATTYNLDPDRIALCGSSAGAMASLVAGTSGLYTDLLNRNSSHSGQSNQVHAVVEVAGATDVGFLDPLDPPLCIIHGSNDNQVDVQNAYDIENAAIQHNIAYDITILPGAGHAIAGDPMGQVVICKKARVFLVNHFI